uniref:Dynein heavy chain 6, axonemal n=1 Tax=Cacopsylla melanoneura TaxID=428564 RepID=A0A8D9BAE7_9HEMI
MLQDWAKNHWKKLSLKSSGIFRFLLRLDYIIQDTKKDLLIRSLQNFHNVVSRNLLFLPSQETLQEIDIDKVIEEERPDEPKFPLFLMSLIVVGTDFMFKPEPDAFVEVMAKLVSSWFDTVYLTMENLMTDPALEDIVQPILKSQKHRYRLGGKGPNFQKFMDESRQALIKHPSEVVDKKGDTETRTKLEESPSNLLDRLYDELHDMFEKNGKLLNEYLKKFETIKTTFKDNLFEDKNNFLGEKSSEEYRELLEKYDTQITDLKKLMEYQPLGMYLVQLQQLTMKVTSKAEVMLDGVLQNLPGAATERMSLLLKRILTADKYFSPSCEIKTDDIHEYLQFVESIDAQMKAFDDELNNCNEMFDLMEKYGAKFSSEDKMALPMISDRLQSLHSAVDKAMEDKSMMEMFHGKILQDIGVLNERIEDVAEKATDPSLSVPDSPLAEVLDKIDILIEELEDIEKTANEYKEYENKIGVPPTEYPILDQLGPDLATKRQLRKGLAALDSRVTSWRQGLFQDLNHKEVKAAVKRETKTVACLEKKFIGNEIVAKMKEILENMRGKLRVIKALRNPSLADRHWQQINDILGVKLDLDKLTLDDLESLKAFMFEEELVAVSKQAKGEAALVALMNQIEKTWTVLEFNLQPYRDSKTVFIINKIEQVQAVLDDSLMHLATILSSGQAADQIRAKAVCWRDKLQILSKILDEWMTLQNNWMYLESIFSGSDISSQLPTEAKMFAEVDRFWKCTMEIASKRPKVIACALRPNFLPQIIIANNQVNLILKALDAYLDTKRVVFPRFYFLSNEEVLEILGQARTPENIQPYLGKCFGGIAAIQFGTKQAKVANSNESSEVPTTDVVAVVSPENETIKLSKGCQARGSVEVWLAMLDKYVSNALKRHMKGALLDFHSRKRTEWVLIHPSQTILTISQLIWAARITEILDPNSPAAAIDCCLKAFEIKCFRDLNELLRMVCGELTAANRTTLIALITIEVHARDVVSSMVKNQVRDLKSFEWIRQLRYYWEMSGTNEDCIVQMALGRFIYGYEYLGASPRLVITPLTDKCYLCLLGALQMNLGGAPTGSSGTGKTETVKDLAKSLGVQCVMLNCSDTLDYKIMGRFFSGMSQSGAWICFDEINRIENEVLSVAAQHLICITNAKNAGLDKFLFEGKMIRLIPSCAAFITLNPGCEGRTGLPDNLKALFRPMAMVLPDCELIAEVVLYSECFQSSKILAQKLVIMYKLCSEQLSQQDHYDFGMRAIKSVLVVAGSLKRANPFMSEDVVLLRALRDSNLPKLLAADAELFLHILNDLFPDIELPGEDLSVEENDSFQQAMEEVMVEHNLQLEVGSFVKVIQLYETMLMRHGVMLVGPTGGGKTTVNNILKWTLTRLFDTNVPGVFFRPVQTYTFNPKSFTSAELYGETNLPTMEWKDGLIGILTRIAVQSSKDVHQWVISDGPIDSAWVENMNSVLDDNKLLCLANAERIKLTENVHIMFEVEDLAQASPATVSRCGMVYVDGSTLGWLPYFKSWLNHFFEKVSFLVREEYEDQILDLFTTYVNPGLDFVRQYCDADIHQIDVSKVSTLCSLFESVLLEPGIIERFTPSDTISSLLVRTFLWAYLWSVGGNLTDSTVLKFELFAREQFADNSSIDLPEGSDLRSYFISKETKQLTPWITITPAFKYDPAMPFYDMVVPTIDTVRLGFVMERLLLVNHPVLFTGVTGVGKTVVVRSVLNKLVTTQDWAALTIHFSGQTSCGRTQAILEGKLQQRTKTVLGAPLGKRLAVFVDDVNMPQVDTCGAQPPIELLRQFLDFKGVYDREKMYWKTIQDVVLCAACAPPSGGRNPLTPRFVRHFALLSIPSPSEDTLKVIFKSILSGFLSVFSAPVQGVADAIINASVEVYTRVVGDLLPTPTRSHYVFNQRDLSKTVQGIMQANVNAINTQDDILRLYYHESLRVFHDRLNNDTDKTYFYSLMKQVCEKHFETPVLDFDDATLIENPPVLLFGYFMSKASGRTVYEEITNLKALRKSLTDYLTKYNVAYSEDMSLLFFMDAICHVTRIARILRTERGHALLVGVSGMGKRSLTKLASIINEYKFHQIDLPDVACRSRTYDYNAFQEDLRRLYNMVAVKNKDVVFLLTDSQILQEEFLEDVHNILNSGEVPNLFAVDELETILSGIRTAAEEAGVNVSERDALYDFFISRVRSKLHVVLSMSPVGDTFRRRCRMFPSMINCCTIDWFNDWPQEALESVASDALKPLDNKELVAILSPMCFSIHESVLKMTQRYYEEVRKHYYVTPSNYLEMLRMYVELLNVNMSKVKEMKARVENGLDKINENKEVVTNMEEQLRDMEPDMKEKQATTSELMANLARDKAAASQLQQVVAQDEAAVKDKTAENHALADAVQKDLASTVPALTAAEKALEGLNNELIVELKGLEKPPEMAQDVLEAVLILLGSIEIDWTTAQAVIGEPGFIERLQNFDKDHVPEEVLDNLKPYLESPNFDPEKIAPQSKVAESLCVWVRSIDIYCKKMKDVVPKRQKLEEAEAELASFMEELRAKKQSLADAEAQIAALEATLDASMVAKGELQEQMDLGMERLARAGTLANALGNEEFRWIELVASLTTDLNNMVGDVLIASAYVAYLGAFTSDYRHPVGFVTWKHHMD